MIPVLIGIAVGVVFSAVVLVLDQSAGYEKACEAHGWQPLTSRGGGMCVDGLGYVRTP